MSKEKDILSDLEKICQSPGYIHALAFLNFRDNYAPYNSDGIKSESDNTEHELIRAELRLLQGLMIKRPVVTKQPEPQVIQDLIDHTQRLLLELHDAMNMDVTAMFQQHLTSENPQEFNPFRIGMNLREPIFYAAESAYFFQYLELSSLRYQYDSEWLLNKLGFSIEDAVSITKAIKEVSDEKLPKHLENMKSLHPNNWELLSPFTFNTDEIEAKTRINKNKINNFLSFFSVRAPCNENFQSIGEFNQIEATPIIQLKDDQYALLSNYCLTEALYESPAFHMGKDESYKSIYSKHQGDFVENFIVKRLERIFGKERVFRGVEIKANKSTTITDIDVLVVYADRALVFQAKSKKLTLLAKQGQDKFIQDDFKKAVGDAYAQGALAARALLDSSYILLHQDGQPLNIRRNFKEVYVSCIVSSHYPSLSFQVKQFLKYEQDDVVQPPFVTDIFFLDTLTEFLDDPMHFLNFVHKRTSYMEKILSNSEFPILGYHLSHNLSLNDEYNIVNLGDDFSHRMDAAMYTRRCNINGERMPKGILTAYKGTAIGAILDKIKTLEIDTILDLAFFFLDLSESAAKDLGDAITELTNKTRSKGKPHDFTVAVGQSGLTFHSVNDNLDISIDRLRKHALLRKYSQKAHKWFALGKLPFSSEPFDIFFVLEFPWTQSDDMDKLLDSMNTKPIGGRNIIIGREIKKAERKNTKGSHRNKPCDCGSNIKAKKCCYR